MRRLVLVKHAMPEVVPGAPPSTWRLGEEGRRGAAELAEHLADQGLGAIYASAEPKALETAQIVGARLGLPVETVPGLHEHERDMAPFLGREQFEAAIARLFARPDELVFGEETARAALERFGAAVDGILARAPAGDLAIVAHGTVISLFMADRTGVDGLALWRSLGLPSCVELRL